MNKIQKITFTLTVIHHSELIDSFRLATNNLGCNEGAAIVIMRSNYTSLKDSVIRSPVLSEL